MTNGAELTFRYAPLGECQVRKYQGFSPTNQYYVHDPNGNIIAIYGLTANRLAVVEQSIYGSGRLGIFQKTVIRMEEETVAAPAPSEKYIRQLGRRQYELADHLGNVHVTLLDRKVEKGVTNGEMGYSPEMYFYTDYYPFGFPMPKRFGRTLYRYGFNGQEKDNEIYGDGQSYNFGARLYDSRLGSWWNVDPELNPSLSPYIFSNNNPILFMDPNGEDPREGGKVLNVDTKRFNVLPSSTLTSHTSFKKRINDKAMWDKFDNISFMETMVGLMSESTLGLTILQKISPNYTEKVKKIDRFLDAAVSDRYSFTEKVSDNIYIERDVRNMGKGFEAEYSLKLHITKILLVILSLSN